MRLGRTLPANEVRRIFDYDPVAGIFIWKDRPERHPCIRARQTGKIAGCANKHGYIKIGIDGKSYAGQVLAWIWYYGEPPGRQVDHIDKNPSNNAIGNLRLADDYQNAQNRRGWKRPLPKGVYRRHRSDTYLSKIMVNGQSKFLGYFKSADDAASAYALAATELHGDFAETESGNC